MTNRLIGQKDPFMLQPVEISAKRYRAS
jgi:hypothetical protein